MFLESKKFFICLGGLLCQNLCWFDLISELESTIRPHSLWSLCRVATTSSIPWDKKFSLFEIEFWFEFEVEVDIEVDIDKVVNGIDQLVNGIDQLVNSIIFDKKTKSSKDIHLK